MRSVRRHRFVLVLLLLIAGLVAAPQARAGTYSISGTCGNWEPVNHAAGRLTAFATCPQLTARNVLGNFRTNTGASAAWIWSAPPGTAIDAASLSAYLIGKNGWQGRIYVYGGPAHGVNLENCPSPSCPENSRWFDYEEFNTSGAQALVLEARCKSSAGCANGGQIPDGFAQIWQSRIILADQTAPSARIGGPLVSPGWRGRIAQVTATGTDNSGIKESSALVDGVPKTVVPRPCNYGRKVPCSNGSGTLTVPLNGLADGTHTATVRVVDAGGNAASASSTFRVDNTPPVGVRSAGVAAGPGWRSENSWTLKWSNPQQRYAPISKAFAEICPQAVLSGDQATASRARARCVTRSGAGGGISSLPVRVPGPGAWIARVWVQDAAGNANRDAAVLVDGLDFDPSPPSQVRFLPQEPKDPARLHVSLSEPLSGIAAAAIEVRRQGSSVWRSLNTTVGRDLVTAFMDDELLRRGAYDVRASVTNRAGLTTPTTLRTDGSTATMKLPVRSSVRLSAGRRVKRCDRRGCRLRWQRRIESTIRRATVITGRLRFGASGLGQQDIVVSERLATGGSAWRVAERLRTDDRGRFHYRAARGPARRLVFRYAGSPLLRGRNANVVLHIPARTSIKPSRRNVVNGEYVEFSGRLRGGHIPPEGALVELQVFTRARWRTFAQPRASADSGEWSFLYRFETIRGNVSFKFRARIRRQSNFPFARGGSRTIRVNVRGL